MSTLCDSTSTTSSALATGPTVAAASFVSATCRGPSSRHAVSSPSSMTSWYVAMRSSGTPYEFAISWRYDVLNSSDCPAIPASELA
eukprot:2378818-Rhodomonas_salina.1